MNLTFDSIFDLMKLFSEEDWEMLVSEDFSPIVKLNLAIENSKTKIQKNKLKQLEIFNFCYENRAEFLSEEFDSYKFTVAVTEKIFALKAFNAVSHEKKLSDIKTRLSEIRKQYIYPFFGLKEIFENSTEFDLAINTLVYFDRTKRKNNYLNVVSDLVKTITNTNYLCKNSAEKLYKFYDKQARHLSINNNLDIKESITNSLEHFDLFSQFEKLEKVLGLLNLAIGRSNVAEKIDYIIKKPSKELLDKHLLLKIDFKIYQLLTNEIDTNKQKANDSKVAELMKLLRSVEIEKLNSIAPFKTQLNILKNFFITKGLETNKQYMHSVLEIIEILDANKLFTQRGKINHVTFKNIIILYLKANQNETAFSFYQKYEKLIQADKNDLTDAIKTYTLGLIKMDNKKYEEAGRLISSCTTINNDILKLYYRQALLTLAIWDVAILKNKESQKNNKYLKNLIKANESYIAKLKIKHPEVENLKNLVNFAKTCFKGKKNQEKKPLTFLQSKWLGQILDNPNL